MVMLEQHFTMSRYNNVTNLATSRYGNVTHFCPLIPTYCMANAGKISKFIKLFLAIMQHWKYTKYNKKIYFFLQKFQKNIRK